MRSPCLPPVFCPGSRWFTRGWWTLNSWSCGRTWCGRRAKRRGSNQVMRNSKNHQKGTMICELVCNIYVICNIYIYIYIIGWKKTRTHTHHFLWVGSDGFPRLQGRDPRACSMPSTRLARSPWVCHVFHQKQLTFHRNMTCWCLVRHGDHGVMLCCRIALVLSDVYILKKLEQQCKRMEILSNGIIINSYDGSFPRY